MIRVEEAEQIILSQAKNYESEKISFQQAANKILAEDIKADRDFPPFHRATMDGIAIRYSSFEKGIRSFRIKAMQAAGETPVNIDSDDECIEIMTGAALPETTDTIVPYEDILIENNCAAIKKDIIRQGQNIHLKGKDCRRNEIIIKAGCIIDPAVIGVLASVGKTELLVKKNPKIIIISTGNELVDVDEKPTNFQLRRSNNYVMQAVLQQYGITAEMLHLPDDPDIITDALGKILQQYAVLLLSGGVSMGKYDYVPQALEKLSIKKFFHKVQQRPGKPFWFGAHSNGALVFAFPGNPVSTFFCLQRYFIPWLKVSLGAEKKVQPVAILQEDIIFNFPLQYFLQVKLCLNADGFLYAKPAAGNGSGDFANLLLADAFMELPSEQTNFKKGEAYKIWPFKNRWL